MNKELANNFLESIANERDQDVEQTSKLLKALSLQDLVKSGNAVSNLVLENVRTGLAGKIFIELTPLQAVDSTITRGDIKVGDIVSVKPSTATTKRKKPSKLKTNSSSKDELSTDIDLVEVTGTVFKITDQQCSITIDDSQEQDAIKLYSFNKLYILKTVNTITYKRMESTMRKLAEFEQLPNNSIIQYLLNSRQFIEQPPTSNIEFHNTQLNQSQKNAIAFTISNEISIIHGPPGTGKTYTLIELIQQLVERGERVLVCGPSNIAVDTILERLAKVLPGNQLLRIGHPARLLEGVLRHSLDVLAKNGDNGDICNDIRKEIDTTISDIKKFKSYKDRREGWKNVKELRKELKIREKKVINDLIFEAKVVVATLHGSSSRELCSVYDQNSKLFDTLIIDEVSQSLEPQCWIPLISHYKSNMKRLVLAGDNQQLPPTVKTENNEKFKKLLETTLFDRLVKQYGDQFKQFLNVQYRMNEQIMTFPSNQMYRQKLIAHDSVKTQVLTDLPGVDGNDDTNVPLIWYDTQGDDFLEQASDETDIIASKLNENEALLVKDHINRLISSNVPQEAIGVITPYSAQTTLLKSMLREKYPRIEISTVDGFQGREKEIIILNLVRSNEDFEIGFLKEERRLNVAMSRPKKQLCVIGNMEMLERSKVKYLKNWTEFSNEFSDIRYPDISELL